ncbi:MAG: hypothetical protein MRERC_3c067 [Mycoplasmataceae bacterium RC_NB112A]|nr:MAG: hypothetical protein MRERC_3c067 [Mycoplasmataceae bacterium RC_NB112A]
MIAFFYLEERAGKNHTKPALLDYIKRLFYMKK